MKRHQQTLLALLIGCATGAAGCQPNQAGPGRRSNPDLFKTAFARSKRLTVTYRVLSGVSRSVIRVVILSTDADDLVTARQDVPEEMQSYADHEHVRPLTAAQAEAIARELDATAFLEDAGGPREDQLPDGWIVQLSVAAGGGVLHTSAAFTSNFNTATPTARMNQVLLAAGMGVLPPQK